jgi:hypothetical protein
MPLELAALSIGIVLLLRVGPDIVLNIHHTNVVTAIADTVVGEELIFQLCLALAGGLRVIEIADTVVWGRGLWRRFSGLKLRTRWWVFMIRSTR